jgi:acyl phosphate:glycerol-3-phosphate acyltransferase
MSVWILPTLAAMAIGYVLGSIPSALWICRIFHQVDITQIGSKNPGMTNVWRTLGWKPALPVAVIDALKGTLAALIGLRMGRSIGAPEGLALVAGVSAVLGHSLSFLAHFKGGKSVLTAFGVFLAISPVASLSALAIWGLVMWRFRIVSLSSLSAAAVLPPCIALESLWHGRTWLSPLIFVSLAVSAFVVWRHRGNIKRLLQGTEHRFKRSPS